MSYCLHCGKPWATHGTVCAVGFADNPPAPPCSECAALRAQLATALAALEAARPIVKHRAVDGSAEADAALDLIAQALDPTAR